MKKFIFEITQEFVTYDTAEIILQAENEEEANKKLVEHYKKYKSLMCDDPDVLSVKVYNGDLEQTDNVTIKNVTTNKLLVD